MRAAVAFRADRGQELVVGLSVRGPIFVLSGVVIAHAYEARLVEGWRPWRFLLTRVIRLWPLYLLGSAIGAGAVATDLLLNGGTHPWQFKPVAADMVRATLLWPQLRTPTAPAFPLDRNAWSLFAELVVNIGYGFGGYRLGNRALGGVAVLGAAIVGWGAFHFASWDAALNLGGLAVHLGVGLGRALYSFPVGVMIYRAWQSGAIPRIRAHPLGLALAFVMVLLVTPGEGAAAPFASCLAIWLAMPLLVVAAVQCESHGRTRLIAQIGGTLSYPVYVLQDGFTYSLPLSSLVTSCCPLRLTERQRCSHWLSLLFQTGSSTDRLDASCRGPSQWERDCLRSRRPCKAVRTGDAATGRLGSGPK